MVRKQGKQSKPKMKPVALPRTGASTDRPLTKREAAEYRKGMAKRKISQ